MHSKKFPFKLLIFPPNIGKIDSSKWQSINLAVNKSPINGSRYLIIDGDLYPTYIPNLVWGPIFIRCGGEIGIYTANLEVFRWKIFGFWP